MKKIGFIILALLMVLGLAGCTSPEGVIKERTGGDSYQLVKINAINIQHQYESWSASGGFFLFAGGGQASGGTTNVQIRKVIVAIVLPVDGSIVLLEINPEIVRLKYDDEKSEIFITLFRSTACSGDFYKALPIKRLLEETMREITITLPKDRVDDYLGVMAK